MVDYTPLIVVENDQNSAMLVVDVQGPFPALEGGATCSVETLEGQRFALVLSAETSSARIAPLTSEELEKLKKAEHFFIGQLDGASITKAREVRFV